MSQGELCAMALNGQAPEPCGMTGLVVFQRADSTYYLLQPHKGLHSGISQAVLQRYAAEGRVRLLAENPIVADSHRAFYVSRSFLTLYEDLCQEPFPWGDAPLYSLREDASTVIITDTDTIHALRQRGAQRFLQAVDARIPQEYFPEMADIQNKLLPNIEHWSRQGALLVSHVPAEEDYYWAFHQRMAAAISLMPGESERLRWTFDEMVHCYYPEVSYSYYAESARQVAANWRIQGELFYDINNRKIQYELKKIFLRSSHTTGTAQHRANVSATDSFRRISAADVLGECAS